MFPRLSSISTLSLSLCLLALAASSTAQNMALNASSSPVEIAYIVTSSTIQTYDVDPQTGFATQEGQPINLPVTYAIVVPSPDDHFLYVSSGYGQKVDRLWVYKTDATGRPQFPAIQELTFTHSTGPINLDPNGTLAYVAQSSKNSYGDTLAQILLLDVDPTTGMLSQSKVVTSFRPNGPCITGINSPGSFGLNGFGPGGNKLYDGWGCSYYDTGGSTYYTQKINHETGTLGPPVQVFAVSDNELSGQLNLVYFTPETLIYFTIPYDYMQGYDSVNVYPLSGGTTPLFSCTATMLEACGYGYWTTPDPSGNYIFINIGDTTQITRLDLAAKTITDTSYYVLGYYQNFSPDDSLVYSKVNSTSAPYFVDIYTFDPATGAVSTTSESDIAVQQGDYAVVPAVRQ